MYSVAMEIKMSKSLFLLQGSHLFSQADQSEIKNIRLRFCISAETSEDVVFLVLVTRRSSSSSRLHLSFLNGHPHNLFVDPTTRAIGPVPSTTASKPRQILSEMPLITEKTYCMNVI